MSSFQSYVSPGVGKYMRDNLHYVQVVRIGDVLKCSGQGGWDTKTENIDLDNLIPTDIGAEIDAAFANADHILKYAGGQGFAQVYKVVTYSTSIPPQHEHIVRNLKKWAAHNAPIWTELGVKELGHPQMHFEIDVEAYDPREGKQ